MSVGSIEQYDRVDFMESYGVVPYSIWDLSKSMQFNNAVEKQIRDRTVGTRFGSAQYFGGAGERTKFKATTSHFNAYLARTVYRSYSCIGDSIFDPFASVVRPFVAMLEGRNYTGCEVRKDEADLANTILDGMRWTGSTTATVLHMDCRKYAAASDHDLVFTCPPYWTHERYSDQTDDMSNIESYDDFMAEMVNVAKVCEAALKPGKFAVVVTGDFRDYSRGRSLIERLVPFTSDCIAAFERSGLYLYDKVVVSKPLGTAPSRVKMWNNRKTVRIHEDLLVFKKAKSTHEMERR